MIKVINWCIQVEEVASVKKVNEEINQRNEVISPAWALKLHSIVASKEHVALELLYIFILDVYPIFQEASSKSKVDNPYFIILYHEVIWLNIVMNKARVVH